MGHFKFNIGIIGGGIGGVAAAVALHRAGIDATVYERANELREVGAGMMLWPNATRVLKELGLLERVAALSGPNRHFLVRSSAGTILMDIGLGHFDVPALVHSPVGPAGCIDLRAAGGARSSRPRFRIFRAAKIQRGNSLLRMVFLSSMTS